MCLKVVQAIICPGEYGTSSTADEPPLLGQLIFVPPAVARPDVRLVTVSVSSTRWGDGLFPLRIGHLPQEFG